MAEEPGAVVLSLEDAKRMAVGQTPCAGAAEELSSSSACEEGDTEPAPGSPMSSGKPSDKAEEAVTPGTMSLVMIEEKFSMGQYRTIDQFVADFRGMLDGCCQLHGADHWMSKQAEKLEIMLEQKLALLPRNYRDRTLSSKSLCGMEDDKGLECPSTRRRSSTRSLSVNTGAMETVMVQVLKQAEFLRAKEEKRLKEQERKEAEEASQKEMEEWDKHLLTLAAPSCMETMWEIPAIGHFLCLAQQILNLPEIVFYELERCLLMPQCSVFLSKIMTSLLCPPHRRPTLHRRPNLPYRAWEAALRQKVQQWYTVIGQAENPEKCAEKLGLCSQFFKILGEVNPLEQKTFHELTFHQKFWLLKGLCDFVYETQTEVQDAVLGQPIHECREVILGYDAQENSYIHFPQFCGADVRVYKQRPLKAPDFPIFPIKIKRIPRFKKSKCKYAKKKNGQLKSTKPEFLPTRTSVELRDGFSSNCHMDSCVSSMKHDGKAVMQPDHQNPCDVDKPASCKENIEKPSSPGELVGYGEPLSPGEIRILENVDKYSDIAKTDSSPLKENALKTFQVHVNGNHTNTEVICHRVAMDIILDHSALNHEKLKLRKLRAKKKKKKKKIKDLLTENTHGRFENLHNTFKSFKTEMHNKFLNKKRAKHKKHKSGKKSVPANLVVKKKKRTVASPAIPEFQLVCTNLDELRELIKKIDEEFKSLESNKKKSAKWHLRKQGVKELRGTLTRLLNELLPWEPKLLKAFQRNRARLRKDYDDFQRLSELENVTRESSSCGNCEPSKSSISATKTSDFCHREIEKTESSELEQKTDICEQGQTPEKEHITNNFLKCQTRSSKRPFKLVDVEDEDSLAQKKIIINLPDISSTSTKGKTPEKNCVANDLQKMETGVLQLNKEALGTLPFGVYKGPNLTEDLPKINFGNKLILMSQPTQAIGSPVLCSDTSSSSIPHPSSGQTPLKSPLHMIYKLPDGQCVPVDLKNSSVKIQMQPVVDAKTGDRLVQQVLVLPKNLFIQQKDDRAPQVNQPTQSDVGNTHCAFNVPLSNSTTSHIDSSLTKGVLCSTQCSTFPVSQTPISLGKSVASMSASQTSKNSTSNFLASVVPSNHYSPSFSIKSDFASVTSSTGNPAVAIQMANSSRVSQSELPDAKQELKTICIRDSQSIRVRTRGGNTGVVKVQTNQDQGTSVITPSPIFNFTPQLQSLLTTKIKPLATSNFTSLSMLQNQPVSSIASACINQVDESNTNKAQVQQPASRLSIQTVGNPMQPNFLPIVTHASTCPPTNSVNTNTASRTETYFSSSSTVQDCSVIRKAGAYLKQTETKTPNVSVVQPDSTTPSKSEFMSGSSIHQLMLLTAPSIHTSGTSSNMGIVASPTLAQVPSKKFVFINTQLPASSTNASITSPTAKQATSNFAKTFVRQPEHVFLLPSTIGSPIKMSSPPIVSQVKDVKIGLTIGQTIVNNTAGMKNVLPINILQNPFCKGGDGTRSDIAMATGPTLSTIHNEQVTSSNITSNYTVASTKGPVASCAAVTSANTVQYSTTERKGNDLSHLSSVSSRLPTTSIGNTVAISTVKTGHLSSSVLISTNPMNKHASSLQQPVSSTLLGTTSSLGATPIVSTYPPPLRLHENTQSIPPTIHKVASTNVTKSPVTMSPSLPPFCKTGPWHASAQALPQLPVSTGNQTMPQVNEPSAQHKLVINTSTPLAPGTQITINGTRFIVPPQGLGAGSHVLLLSTNARQGFLPVGNAQVSPALLGPTASHPAVKQSISPMQYPSETFKCNAAPDMSKSLSKIQSTSQTVNVTSSDFSSCSLSSVNKSLSTAALQPLFINSIQSGNQSHQTNMALLSRGTPVPEAVLLNTAISPANLLPASVMLESKRADDGYRPQSSTTDKSHTVAT